LIRPKTGERCSGDVELKTMSMKLYLLVYCILFVGSADAEWQSQTYTNNQSVARVLFDGWTKLRTAQMKPGALIPTLQDTRVLFVDDDRTRITVRDVAYAMLDEAGLTKQRIKASRTKLICGCEVKGEWFRFHIPELTDQDFDKVKKTIQPAARLDSPEDVRKRQR
jgi:hypothetical protein